MPNSCTRSLIAIRFCSRMSTRCSGSPTRPLRGMIEPSPSKALQCDRASACFVAKVGAVGDPVTLAGTVEIEPAELDSATDVPNAVENSPLALVSALLEATAGGRSGECIFAAHIPGQWEADRPSRHDTVTADVPLVSTRIGIPEPRARRRGR